MRPAPASAGRLLATRPRSGAPAAQGSRCRGPSVVPRGCRAAGRCGRPPRTPGPRPSSKRLLLPDLQDDTILDDDLGAAEFGEEVVAHLDLDQALHGPLRELGVEHQLLGLAQSRLQLRPGRLLASALQLQLLAEGPGLWSHRPLQLRATDLAVELLLKGVHALDGVFEVLEIQPLEAFCYDGLNHHWPADVDAHANLHCVIRES